jgi:[acyl-carrier-protein] S-malonyltransferase
MEVVVRARLRPGGASRRTRISFPGLEHHVLIAALFPGQGSQVLGMADPWLGYPRSREVLDRASEVLGWDVAERSRDPEALARTEMVQPALFACDLAAFAAMEADGIQFHVAAGHSLGEYAALVAAGAVSFEEGLRTLAVRAEAMGRAAAEQPGTMTAIIGLSPQEAHEVCEIAGRGDVLSVANENAPKQVVLSGTVEAVERAEEVARSRGGRAIRLQVAGAFHSPLMQPAIQPVRDAISRMTFAAPRFIVVPNVSGRPTTHPVVLRDQLSRQMPSPVRWDQTMRSIAELGVDRLLELGPGDVLTKLGKRALPDAGAHAVGSPEAASVALEEIHRAEELEQVGASG